MIIEQRPRRRLEEDVVLWIAGAELGPRLLLQVVVAVLGLPDAVAQAEGVEQRAVEANGVAAGAGDGVLLLQRQAQRRGTGPQQSGEVGRDRPFVQQTQLPALGQSSVVVGDDLVGGLERQLGHGLGRPARRMAKLYIGSRQRDTDSV